MKNKVNTVANVGQDKFRKCIVKGYIKLFLGVFKLQKIPDATIARALSLAFRTVF